MLVYNLSLKKEVLNYEFLNIKFEIILIIYTKIHIRMIKMDKNIVFKIGYGLYMLSAQDKGKNNGCIINTVMQVTDVPLRIAVTVNKKSLTGKMVSLTQKMNISILSQSVPFSTFEIFGFKSGEEIDKFSKVTFKKSKNGLCYLDKNVVGYMSCEVQDEIDLGTHKMFICNLIDSEILSNEEPLTYAYYHTNIKPKPKKENKTGWRCIICGYIYEGENLPSDFICPWCKHGAVDFERIQ